MVLKIGIFFKILLNISKNFLPKKDKEIHPINVINTSATKKFQDQVY